MIVLHGVKSEERNGKAQVQRVRALAAERGIVLKELVTERSEHCEELVQQANLTGVDAIGLMGGDGTMREAVSGMLKRAADDRCPLFVFPVGTGNNFARDLGIKTIEDMFAVIDRGVTHSVDAVKVTHPEGVTYSINCVTWGRGGFRRPWGKGECSAMVRVHRVYRPFCLSRSRMHNNCC